MLLPSPAVTSSGYYLSVLCDIQGDFLKTKDKLSDRPHAPGARDREQAAGEEHIAEPAQVRARGPAVHPGNVSQPRVPPHATCPQPVTVTVYAWNPRGRSEAVTVVRGVEIADTRAEAGPGQHSDYAGSNGRALKF